MQNLINQTRKYFSRMRTARFCGSAGYDVTSCLVHVLSGERGMMSLPASSHVPFRGWGVRGVSGHRRVWSQRGIWHYPPCEQANRCENITFPQFRWRAVINIINMAFGAGKEAGLKDQFRFRLKTKLSFRLTFFE